MSQELLAQSALINELNQSMIDMSNNFNRTTDMLSQQTQLMNAMNAQLERYSNNSTTLNTDVANLQNQFERFYNQRFTVSEQISNRINRNNTQTELQSQQLDAVAEQYQAAASQNSDLERNAQEQERTVSRSFDPRLHRRGVRSVDNATEDINKSQKKLKKQGNILKRLLKNTEIGKGLSSSWGAWSLFLTIPKTLIGIAGIITNVATSSIGIIADLTKTVMTIPFTIATMLVQPANEIRQKIVEGVGNAVESFKDEIDLDSYVGQGAAKLGRIASGSLKALQDSKSRLTQRFGYDSPENIVASGLELYKGLGQFGEFFGRSLLDNINNLFYVIEAQKAMGASNEEMKYYALEAATSTGSYIDTLSHNLSTLSKTKKEYNIDFKNLSRYYHKLRLNITQFGHLTARELSKVSATLIRLKLSSEDAVGLFGRFSSYEEAASASAKLFQSFGMLVDAYDLIAADNPAEIAIMLRDSMKVTGKNFEILDRHERQLLQGITGVSEQGLSTIFSYKNMALSQEELRKKMSAEDPTKVQLKVIRELTSAIKQIKKVLNFNSPFEALWKGLQMNMGTVKEMKKLNVELSETYESLNSAMRRLKRDKIESIITPINMFLIRFNNMINDGTLINLFTKGIRTLGNLLLGLHSEMTSSPIDNMILTFFESMKEQDESIQFKYIGTLESRLTQVFSVNEPLKQFFKEKNIYFDNNGELHFESIDSLMMTLLDSLNHSNQSIVTGVTQLFQGSQVSGLYESLLEQIISTNMFMQDEKAKVEKSIKDNSQTSTRLTKTLTKDLTEIFNEGSPLFQGFFNLGTLIAGTIVRSAMKSLTLAAYLLSGNQSAAEKFFTDTNILEKIGFNDKEYQKLSAELKEASRKFANEHGFKQFGIAKYALRQIKGMGKFFFKLFYNAVEIALLAAYDRVESIPFGQTMFEQIFPNINYKKREHQAVRENLNLESYNNALAASQALANDKWERLYAENESTEAWEEQVGTGFTVGVVASGGAAYFIPALLSGPLGWGALLAIGIGGYLFGSNMAESSLEALADPTKAYESLLNLKNSAELLTLLAEQQKIPPAAQLRVTQFLDYMKNNNVENLLVAVKNLAGNNEGKIDISQIDNPGDKTNQTIIKDALRMMGYAHQAMQRSLPPEEVVSSKDMFVKLHDADKLVVIAAKQQGAISELLNQTSIMYHNKIKDVKHKVSLKKESVNIETSNEDVIIDDLISKVTIFINKVKDRKIEVKPTKFEFV